MRYVVLVITGVFLLLADVAAAQDRLVGKTVSAKTAVPIRVAPPAGIPLAPGEIVFTASPNQRFEVVELKTIQALFFTDAWIRVRSTDDGQQGWGYWGRDLQDSPNFAVE